MPYLQLNEKRYPLRVGETRVGAGAGAEVSIPGPAATPASVQAIVDVSREHQVSIRRADGTVRVNGVQLGAEPTPLIHGDKIEIWETELFYGDDRRGGSTQFISSVNVPDLQKLRSPTPSKATAASGGRVISLVDGREYLVPPGGLAFGRDAACDVVIPSSDVSRRHAEIVAGDVGYVLSDTSTNGVFVNGVRIEALQVLGRGDVIRLGTEEFRFYADVLAPAGPPVPAPHAAPAGVPVAAAAPVVAASAVASTASRPEAIAPAAPMPAPVVPAPAPLPARPPLATLEVIGDGSGIPRGRTFPIMSVLAHVGRGAHNDIVLAEESVSDAHAKLQRRDGVWYVTDLDSTNGTYVNGRRLTVEDRLSPDADLRIGGVKLAFRLSLAEPSTEPRAFTRQYGVPETARRAVAPAVGRGRASPERSSPERSSLDEAETVPTDGIPWWAWLVAVAAIGAVAAYVVSR
jgi:pSer/pThr/pTyr-binding forkhead associated (FHA) protein